MRYTSKQGWGDSYYIVTGCGRRSDEYTAWPSCSNCMGDICDQCMAPGTLDTGDGDRGDRCYCKPCNAILREEY